MEYLLITRDTENRSHDHPAQLTAARHAAEALFRPKVPEPARPALTTAPPARDQSGRRPRILRAVEPAQPSPEHVVSPVDAAMAAAPSIPRSDLPRIKTWLKYGMTIAQVAQLYGLAIHELERLL
jgi:hypothetical protein